MTLNELRQLDDVENRFNRFLNAFPNVMGNGDAHGLEVGDCSPEAEAMSDPFFRTAPTSHSFD
jgi:hypothetical protein